MIRDQALAARRAAGRADRRAVGEAVPAARPLERAGRRPTTSRTTGRASTAAACTRSGSGRSPRRRWSRSTRRPRDLHRPRDADQHAAAGPRRAERRHVRRGRPRLRRADDARTCVERRPEARLRAAFQLATARRPPRPRAGHPARRVRDQLGRVPARSRTARKLLINAGESTRDPRLDPASWRPYTAMAQLILNLDETITKE